MPAYRYQVRSGNGQTTVGVLNAQSVAAAADSLRRQGAQVLSIAPVPSSDNRAALLERLRELNSGKPNQKHVLDFTTQLAVMVRAGIGIRTALEGIAEQTTHYKFKQIILGLKYDVESGKQFSEALARHPKLFNPLYVNMVRASEMSGSFGKSPGPQTVAIRPGCCKHHSAATTRLPLVAVKSPSKLTRPCFSAAKSAVTRPRFVCRLRPPVASHSAAP